MGLKEGCLTQSGVSKQMEQMEQILLFDHLLLQVLYFRWDVQTKASVPPALRCFFFMSWWSKRATVLRQRPWPQRPHGQIHIARPNRWWLCWGPRPCDEYDQIRLAELHWKCFRDATNVDKFRHCSATCGHFTNKNVMKHSYNMIHTTFGHSIPSSQIIHILVLMLLDVERSQNVEIWINWILCINWIAQVPHEPRSSAMPNWTWSSPSLLLPGGSTESARFLCDRTHVIILQKKKTEKVMEIYQNCCKISTTGRFGNPLFVETRDFLPTFYVCNRAISPRVGNCHLSPSLSRHGRRCCHGGLRPTRLWRGWLSQLRSSTPSATCLREKPVTLAPLSWTPRWMIYLSTLKCRLIYSS